MFLLLLEFSNIVIGVSPATFSPILAGNAQRAVTSIGEELS